MRINHNISALQSLHQLARTNSKLDKTLERLSSGLRINHAADDAAGLAISQKMDTQVRGLEQANRNAMDGISLIQTAEGALNEVHSMLQRIRELSIQVSNGTYDATDRKNVQDEVSQLQDEITRISENIEFNEIKLLNGDIDRRAFSTDKDIADIVSMSDTVEAGDYSFEVTQTASMTKDTGGSVSLFDGTGKATVEGTLNINGEQVDIEIGDSSEEVFSKIRDLCDTVSVDVTVASGSPFGNGEQLSLKMREYGPETLDITGDTALLASLGLDADHFNPNSEVVYHTTTSFTLPISGISAPGTGEVLINGMSVSITNGDDMDDVLGSLRAADIPGVEFGLDGSGQIEVFSTKPVTVEAASGSTEDGDAESALSSLVMDATTDALATTTTKSVGENAIDTAAGSIGASDVIIRLDGTNATTVSLSGVDLTTSGGIESVVGELNNAAPAGTTFAYDEISQKIVSYNTAGSKVTIVPADNTAITADVAAADALGFEEASYETKLGNKGRNIQIDPTSIATSAFPENTTYSTDGQFITFRSSNSFELKLRSGGNVGNVTMNLLETGPLDLQIGANEGQFMEIRVQNLSPEALGIDKLNLSTSDGAQEAIGIVDNAINMISSVRSKLGAYQNRLEHTVANLDTASENMTSSLSRIQDADMAYEMAEYTQKNILSQAGTSMLAQANQRPQQILQLLQQ